MQEALLNWSNGTQAQASDEVYERLVKAVKHLEQEFTSDQIQNYRVVWESENHDFKTTDYKITGFYEEIGETRMKVVGGRGGNYEIIPKPANPPWIRYLPPEGSESAQWEEPLHHLAILSKDFEYDRGPAGMIEMLKEKFPSVHHPEES